MLYARITAAMALLLQPADCLLLSAATVRAPVAHSASFALSPVAAPRSSIIEMGRGDKRTAKGKRRAGTHGVCRPTNAELRIRREGPMSPAASPPASPPPAPPPAAAPAAPAPAPPPAPPPAPEPEPEPAAAAPAAAMSAGELMKLVKALKAELPRAEMKQCKQALEATGGDVAAAKSAIEGEMASAWAAEDEAKAISIKEGSTVLMNQRDAKLKKKFEQPEPETWYDGKPAADEAAAVAEAAPAPAPAPAAAAEAAPSTTTVVQEVVVGYPSKEVVVVDEVVLGLAPGSAATAGYSCNCCSAVVGWCTQCAAQKMLA